MTTAAISVLHAGPLVTLQDAGRAGWLRYGIPASGPMDRFAHATANLLCAQPEMATAIEVSAGGLTITAPTPVTIGVAGADVRIDGDPVGFTSGTITVDGGCRIAATPAGTSWAYLSVAGGIETRTWLGATATHARSSFGGGVLGAGQTIELLDARTRPELDGPISDPWASEGDDPIRLVLGPQTEAFASDALERLTSATYACTSAVDRMGMRLDGPSLDLDDALGIPSEPIVRGSIQVAGDGQPTVLMADHQTTGGYPKIATVISTDTDRLARATPGTAVRFESVSPEHAIETVRAATTARRRILDGLSAPDRTLAQRLARQNLNFGGDTEWDGR